MGVAYEDRFQVASGNMEISWMRMRMRMITQQNYLGKLGAEKGIGIGHETLHVRLARLDVYCSSMYNIRVYYAHKMLRVSSVRVLDGTVELSTKADATDT